MWIDIPVLAKEPAESALLTQFLVENGFRFEQSHRFFSVPAFEADRLAERVQLWAFNHDMPEDSRVQSSLDGTLTGLGEVVLLAIAAARANVAPNASSAAAIDLTRSQRR